MQGRGDVPQEVEARHEERRQKESCEEYGPERCRLDKLRRRRRKMNLSECPKRLAASDPLRDFR